MGGWGGGAEFEFEFKFLCCLTTPDLSKDVRRHTQLYSQITNGTLGDLWCLCLTFCTFSVYLTFSCYRVSHIEALLNIQS